MMLGLKMSTPNVMIYGELGITTLNLDTESRFLNFWARNINSKQDKISVILYKLVYELHKRDIFHSPWIIYVKNTLDNLGLSNYWLSQSVNNLCSFKRKVKTIIHDNSIQKWKNDVFETPKCTDRKSVV